MIFGAFTLQTRFESLSLGTWVPFPLSQKYLRSWKWCISSYICSIRLSYVFLSATIAPNDQAFDVYCSMDLEDGELEDGELEDEEPMAPQTSGFGQQSQPTQQFGQKGK